MKEDNIFLILNLLEFPILIVNDWFEITEKKLNENYNKLENEIIIFLRKLRI